MKILLVIVSAVLLSCTPQQQDKTVHKRISATEYKEKHADKKEAVLVDVRTPAEFEAGHLQKTIMSDYQSGQFQEEMPHWDKSKTYYLYCASGNRSGKAAKLMEEAGFKSVYNIGGYEDLKEAGLPTTAEAE